MRVEIVELKEFWISKHSDALNDIRKCTAQPIQLVARDFEKNVSNTRALVLLPTLLMVYAIAYGRGISDAARAIVEVQRLPTEQQEEKLNELYEQSMAIFKSEQDVANKFISRALGDLDELCTSFEMLIASINSLLMAGLTSTWSTFECLAADCWETTLNSMPLPFGQNAISRLPENSDPESISKKQVSVGLLAKFGFDLRGKIGTVLRPKFDFTSVSGIRVAYKAAFQDLERLEAIFGNPRICHLEALRHLIVHRGGIIDDEFKRRTKSKIFVGQPLQFEGNTLRELFECSVESSSGLLTFCNEKLLNSGHTDTSRKPNT